MLKKHQTNKIKTVITVFLCLLIAGPFVAVCSIPLINDNTAFKVRKILEDTPLPQHTELCDAVCAAGKLNGNGNGMQYFGGILIKSALTLEELENYYAKYRQNEWEYVVEPQKEAEIEPVEHRQLEFSCLKEKEKDEIEGYYIVYTWGSSRSVFGEFDLRGH